VTEPPEPLPSLEAPSLPETSPPLESLPSPESPPSPEVPEASERPASRWSRQIIGPFTVRHVAIVGAILALGAFLLAVLTTPIGGPANATPLVPGSGFYQFDEPSTELAIGQKAPELEGTADGSTVPLLDLDGQPITLSERRGRPVWLSFFATWCPPCQEETPVLREAHERYAASGLEMVAVSVQETTAEDVAAYAERYSLPYTIGFDATSAVFRSYRGFGLPTHVFIDADGVIRHLRYGPMDRGEMAAIVEPLLAADS
jgi:thiol-disulfide isomerase/thioredoxin